MDPFHQTLHHDNNKVKIDKLVKIQTYHSTVMAKFAAKLAALENCQKQTKQQCTVRADGCNR